jgi:hypothetical protein
MKEQPNYYGIITAEVRYDKNLPANAKLLYSEITALCNKEGYCYATNGYFADLYQVSDRSITFWLQKLAQCGYIDLQIDKNSKGTFRRIYLTRTNQTSIPVSNLTSNPIEANFYTKEYNNNNNTILNNKKEYKENSFSENQIKKQVNNKAVEIYPTNFTDKMIKASNDFFEYRKQIGKAFKADKSIQTKLSQWSQQIDNYGENAVIESIQTAIANQYQGTFIDKQYLTQSNTQKPLIDDKGNYADTDAGREQFILDVRELAAKTFRK